MKSKTNLFKKVGAGILASALLFQSAVVPAADIEIDSVIDADTGSLESVSDVSTFGVSMNLDLPAAGDNFHVELKDEEDTNANYSTDIITNTHGTEASGVITNVPVDTATGEKSYTLVITAPGYATYTQPGVAIHKGMTTKVEINNSKQKNDLLGPDSAAKHAVMAIGDVNADGKVDENDEQAMIKVINSNTTDSNIAVTFDLNNDGNINVADLAYITHNKGENVDAVPLNIISAENIQPEIADNTVVKDGNVNDLIQSQGNAVQLAPANDEEISDTNPVEVSLNINDAAPEESKQAAGIVIKPPAGSENRITKGTVQVEGVDLETGEEVVREVEVKDTSASQPVQAAILPIFADLFASPDSIATVESDGTVVVNIGKQIAIKKVTIKVTGSSTKLVDIAEVEFVNNMESRIPEPELNIPEITEMKQTEAGLYPKFTVSWTAQNNVDGYDINVSQGSSQQTFHTNKTTMTVQSLNSGDLKQYVPYTVRVCATSGDWKSKWSESKTIEMDSMKNLPPKTENAKAEAKVESILVTWKATMHSQWYSVHYREEGTQEYTVADNITGTSHTILNLKAGVTYEIYVIGHNNYGSGSEYELLKAEPKASNDVAMPMRKLINKPKGRGELMSHIKSVEFTEKEGENILYGDINAPVDNNQDTYAYVREWDTGYTYSNYANPIITLDDKYTIDTIRFTPSGSQPHIYSVAAIRYKDDNGAWQRVNANLSLRADAENNRYYTLIADHPVTSDTYQLLIQIAGGSRPITIAEMRFYEYEDIATRINNMYADDMHIQLNENVTEDMINGFRKELDEKDDESGELHPERDNLLIELDYAQQLLETKGLNDIIHIDTKVSAKLDNGFDDFAMPLTDLQPIGVAAETGKELVIYLGSATDARNTNTSLKLVATQMHNDSSFGWSKDITTLKAGRNVIKIPTLGTYAERENGGSLYVQWTGINNRDYTLRVSGGTKIPMLNVAGVTGADRTEAIEKYVDELSAHVSGLENEHNKNHTPEKKYDERNCVANLTEIVMDNMMYSVPASQILKGIENGGAAKLEKSIEAMEQQVDLFYQYKGLNKKENYNDEGKLVFTSTNRYPMQRLNIRYHAMFAGAFMYASGKHIGIEYDSVPELASLTPFKADEKGNKTEGQLSGWGIAHEMGHVINNRNYVVAEVTNNFFSLLATQSIDRIKYDDVYDAVTRGSIGAVPKGQTLGMYWQLHSYYDDYYDYKMFDNIDDQLANNFFARMDAYSRNTALAPDPNGKAAEDVPAEGEEEESSSIPLVMTKSTSDNLIRLASAAAKKSLIPFFEAWGFTYGSDTAAYVSQFPTETKKIQYFNNDAREYKLSGGEPMAKDTAVTAEMVTPHEDSVVNSQKIEFKLGSNGGNAMLGYEIIRNDVPVAFVTADKTSYTDVITTGNNMVYEYKVIGYDKLLNTTDAVELAPVKVKHDGTIGRDNWSIETNMKSDDDKLVKATGDSEYCEDTYISAISSIIGQGDSAGYTGNAVKDEEGNIANAEFTINLGDNEQVTAIKYNGAAAKFAVYVSEDNSNWTKAKDIDYDGEGEQKFYFNNPDEPGYMYIYNAASVKIVYESTSATVSDVNILGPTSDNVELVPLGIGRLNKAYTYDDSDPSKYTIPEGSVIFTGQYKGSPAYNVVKLLEGEKRNEKTIVDGYQIILAEPPQNGELGDVSDGIWIYWIEPKDIEAGQTIPKVISAELYRVDDAHTLDGERMVSNTLNVTVPDTLQPIEINADPNTGAETVSETGAAEDINYSDSVKAGSESSELMAGTEESTEPPYDEPAEPYEHGFVFKKSEDDRRASMELQLAKEDINTIAFQTEFNISDPASDVKFEWSDIIKEKVALGDSLLQYTYENGKLNLYVIADCSILDEEGKLEVGNISFDSDDETKDVLITVEQKQTVSVHSDFKAVYWDQLNGMATLKAGVDVTTSTEDTTQPTTENVTNKPTSTEDTTQPTTENVTNKPTESENKNLKAEPIGANAINFVAGVDSIHYEAVGFIFEANGKKVEKETNIVYTSIFKSIVKLDDLENAEFMYAFTITDIGDLDAPIKVTPYKVKDGKKIESEPVVYTYNSLK